MHGGSCPIHLIRLIGQKSFNFEKIEILVKSSTFRNAKPFILDDFLTFLTCQTCLSIVAVAHPDFAKAGRQPQSGQNLFGITSAENCMKNKKELDKGGERSSRPLDPILRHMQKYSETN